MGFLLPTSEIRTDLKIFLIPALVVYGGKFL
jgi:hypothetical protein